LQAPPGVGGLISGHDDKSYNYLLIAAYGAHYPQPVQQAAISKLAHGQSYLCSSPSTLPQLSPLPAFADFEATVKSLPNDWERAKYIVDFTYQNVLYGWMQPLQGQVNIANNPSELNRMSAPELYNLVTDRKIMGVCNLFSGVAHTLLSQFGIESIICNPSITGKNGDVRGHVYLEVYVSVGGKLQFVPMDPTSGCYWAVSNGEPMTFDAMFSSLNERHFAASSRVKITPSSQGMFAEPGWGVLDSRSPDDTFLYDVADHAFALRQGMSAVFGPFCVITSKRDLRAWELENVVAGTYMAYAVEQGYPSVWEYVAGLAGLKTADWEHNVPVGLNGSKSAVNLFIQDYQALANRIKNVP
jgi:hypothetical protein